jgi:hypothetical protein
LIVARPGHIADAYQFNVAAKLRTHAVDTTALRFSGKGTKLNLVWVNVPRAELEGLRSAPEIRLRGDGFDEGFALPGIGAVLKSLDECTTDLRRY